jgi:hypothetical protein
MTAPRIVRSCGRAARCWLDLGLRCLILSCATKIPPSARGFKIGTADAARDSHDWRETRGSIGKVLDIDGSLATIWVQYGPQGNEKLAFAHFNFCLVFRNLTPAPPLCSAKTRRTALAVAFSNGRARPIDKPSDANEKIARSVIERDCP